MPVQAPASSENWVSEAVAPHYIVSKSNTETCDGKPVYQSHVVLWAGLLVHS